MPFHPKLGNRIPYDRDGTAVLIRRDLAYGGDWIDAHPNAKKALNSSSLAGMVVPQGSGASPPIWQDNNSSGVLVWQLNMVFPVPTMLEGIFFQSLYRDYANSFGADLRWETLTATLRASENTTNGIDGEWFDVPGIFLSEYMASTTVNPGSNTGYRVDTGGALSVQQMGNIKAVFRHHKNIDGNGVQGVNLRNVRGLSFSFSAGSLSVFGSYDEQDRVVFLVHLYGHPDTLAEKNMLAAWHPTFNIRVLPDYLDWGDVTRPSGPATKQFRVKNLSPSMTANSVVISAEDEYGSATPAAAQLQFSLDGTTWASTVTITSVAAGAASSVLYVRRTTPDNSPLGSLSPRINMTPGSWS